MSCTTRWLDMRRQRHEIVPVVHLRTVADQLFSCKEEVLLAYLYGSYATGDQNEFSDVDIGIVLRDPDGQEPGIVLDLAVAFENALQHKVNVDLRVLNDVTPRFLHAVLRDAVALYCADPNFKDEFELHALREYLDVKPMLDRFDNLFIVKTLEKH